MSLLSSSCAPASSSLFLFSTASSSSCSSVVAVVGFIVTIVVVFVLSRRSRNCGQALLLLCGDFWQGRIRCNGRGGGARLSMFLFASCASTSVSSVFPFSFFSFPSSLYSCASCFSRHNCGRRDMHRMRSPIRRLEVDGWRG